MNNPNHPRIARKRQALLDEREAIEAQLADLAELLDLEIRQREWLDLQRQLDAAADLLEAQGVQTDREPWCWNDSPHAARLTEIEQMLET